MSLRILAMMVAGLVLVSCGSANGGDQRARIDEGAPILLHGGDGGTFYPRDVPTGTMSAQAAYNVIGRQDDLPPKPIPANVTPRFGLLTRSDKQPSAYRTPVWAFISKGCETSGNPTPAPTCIGWVFVRASDGRRLGWATQPLS
jgi:hypothetical protein